VRITGLFSDLTLGLPPAVRALQCAPQPGRPQQVCGVTEIPGTTTSLLLQRTVGVPEVAVPPAVLGSPWRWHAGISPVPISFRES
jgi:hypothetical protein